MTPTTTTRATRPPPSRAKSQSDPADYRETGVDGGSVVVAVTSGLVRDVPATSSFVSGDVDFEDLSTDALALVTGGRVTFVTVLLQRRTPSSSSPPPAGGDRRNGEWTTVSVSRPSVLDLACTAEGTAMREDSATTEWNCTCPRTVDVLFSLPHTAILAWGADVRVDILFSTELTDDDDEAMAGPTEASGRYRDDGADTTPHLIS